MFSILISIILFFLLKKKIGFTHSLIIIFINLILIYYFYNYEFFGFKNDSKEYYENTKHLFNNFTIIEIFFGVNDQNIDVQKHPYFDKNLFSKIYLFFYLIFFLFGEEPYNLSIFYLFLRCISFIYISNFLSRKSKNFKNKELILGYLILLNPWTIYYQNFFFLKEGVIIFACIVNIISFYKIFEKIRIRYVFYIFISLMIIYYFRYYLTYLLIFFYFMYFLYFYFYLSIFNKNLISSYIIISLLFIVVGFFLNYQDILNIITNHLNLLSPLRYLFSPLFINIAINEDFNIRLIISLLDNFISYIFLLSLIRYDFKNEIINYLIIFILTIVVPQMFAPSEILTGGRHRGFIFWSMAVIIVLRLKNDKKKKNKNSLFLQ